MFWIAIGFCLPFLAAFWLSGLVGARWQSSVMGAVVGLFSLGALIIGYVSLLYLWVRAQLIAFIENELPILLNRLVQLIDQYWQVKESV